MTKAPPKRQRSAKASAGASPAASGGRRYQKSANLPAWVNTDLAELLKRWKEQPIDAGANPKIRASEKNQVLTEVSRLLTEPGMVKVWAWIESQAVRAGQLSGKVAGEALFRAALAALRTSPSEAELEVLHGGRQASIAAMLRQLVSDDWLDRRPGFTGYERCVEFRQFCDEAIRIAEHFETEATNHATWQPDPLKNSPSTDRRARFVKMMAAALLDRFGETSTAILVTMSDIVFPDQPIERTTVDDYVKGIKALKIDGLSP